MRLPEFQLNNYQSNLVNTRHEKSCPSALLAIMDLFKILSGTPTPQQCLICIYFINSHQDGKRTEVFRWIYPNRWSKSLDLEPVWAPVFWAAASFFGFCFFLTCALQQNLSITHSPNKGFVVLSSCYHHAVCGRIQTHTKNRTWTSKQTRKRLF